MRPVVLGRIKGKGEGSLGRVTLLAAVSHGRNQNYRNARETVVSSFQQENQGLALEKMSWESS